VALAKGTGGAVVDTGGKSWFFVTADYAFGHALEADTSKIIEARGGKVLGSVKTPLNASDFSSFLLQAQNSKAQILGLANAGGDTINSIKAAKEFGVTKNMKLAGLLVFFSDIHSLGLKNTEGMQFTALVLGHERRLAQVCRRLHGQDPAPPQRDPGRRLLGHHELPQGRGKSRHARCRQGHGHLEKHQDRRLLRPGLHP
jgi:hypothetical protein